MCACGETITSGPVDAAVYLATPRNAEAREFTDKTAADTYVAVFGGGSVISKQPVTAGK